MASILNSSIAPLQADGKFSGTYERIRSNIESISVVIKSDQIGELKIIFTDSPQMPPLFTHTFTYDPNNDFNKVVSKKGVFVKIQYTNGPVAQTEFQLKTYYKTDFEVEQENGINLVYITNDNLATKLNQETGNSYLSDIKTSVEGTLNTNVTNQVSNYALETTLSGINSKIFKCDTDNISGSISISNQISGFNLQSTQLEIKDLQTPLKYQSSSYELLAQTTLAPGQTIPFTAPPSTLPQEGWYYKNTATSQPSFLYYYSYLNPALQVPPNQKAYTLGDVTCGFAVVKLISLATNGTPYLGIYTRPTGSGDAQPGFYKSRKVYTIPNGASLSQGMQILIYWGTEPDIKLYPNISRIAMTLATTTGTALPTEQLAYLTFSSDSSATAGAVEYVLYNTGFIASGIYHDNKFNCPNEIQPISGSISVSNFPATQAISGSVNIGNFPTTQAISGSVSISNLPTTQAISGSVDISNFPTTQAISGSVNIGNFPTTQAVSVSNFPTTQAISGSVDISNFPLTQAVSVSNFPATQAISGSVDISNFPLTQAVSVSNFPATQAISGSVDIGNFPATQAISGSVNIGNFPTTQAISGAVSVSNQPAFTFNGSGALIVSSTGGGVSSDVNVLNFPATQAISGSVSISNFPTTQAVSGSVDIGNFPTTQAVSVANFPTTQAISGSVSISNFPTTQAISGSVSISNFPTTQAISGSVDIGNFPTTQAISGSVNIGNFPTTQAISGSVNIGNFPATQSVSVANSSIDTHIYGSSDGNTWHHVLTTPQGRILVNSQTQSGSGQDITSTTISTKTGLDVNVINNTDPATATLQTTGNGYLLSTVSNLQDLNTKQTTANGYLANIEGSLATIETTIGSATQKCSIYASNETALTATSNRLNTNSYLLSGAGDTITATGSSLNVNCTNNISSINIKDSSGANLNSTSNALNVYQTNEPSVYKIIYPISSLGSRGNLVNNATLNAGASSTALSCSNFTRTIISYQDSLIASSGTIIIEVSIDGTNYNFLGRLIPIRGGTASLRTTSAIIDLGPFSNIRVTNDSADNFTNVLCSVFSWGQS